MTTINPMSTFIDRFPAAAERMEDAVDSVRPGDLDSGAKFAAAKLEMQRDMWATQLSLKTRHGLLKKILTEVR